MDFKEILTAFTAEAGLDDGPIIEDGACHLEIDGRDVGFMEIDGGRRMVVWTAISPCPVDRREAFLLLLLRANFMERMLPEGAFSLSDDDIVYAHSTFALPAYEKEDFYRRLRSLLDAVKEWGRLAEAYGRTVGPNSEPDAESIETQWVKV